MVDDNADLESRFRAEAAVRSLPPDEVEAWIGIALPAAYAAEGGEGPLVVRLGGAPMLPKDAPRPGPQFVADVDCALLPLAATDLPLPADGHLLFFADPDVSCSGVSSEQVVYVPAGTPTVERPGEEPWPEPYREQELRTLWHQLSWPYDEGGEYDEQGRWRERPNELPAVWSHVVGGRPGWTFQIGGHADIANSDPVDAARSQAAPGDGHGGDRQAEETDDWTLLATWQCREDVKELDQGVIHWVVRRQDLAALSFDRVFVHVDMV